MPDPAPLARQPVPWRTIWAAIFSVLLTYVGVRTYLALTHIVTFLVVALFFTIVLNPAVDFLEHRAHLRRGFATLVVFLIGLGLIAGMLYAFIRPLVDQVSTFADDLPGYVDDAKEGKGTVGDLVDRYNLQDYVKKNDEKLRKSVSGLGAPALDVARSVFSGIFGAVTAMVLTVLMLLQAPHLTSGILNLVPSDRRERFRRVATDASRAVSGYVFGNVVISVIAGVSAWIVLAIVGVPYAGVLGLFVAFTDLIPLVGATLGAVPTVLFAFLYSVPAGISTVIFFIIYQQFENHVLQVSIMSRTVDVNPLTVLVSVLIGVELFGILGALLAIPVAGVVQVIVRDIYDERQGRLKPEPTVGTEEQPITDTPGPALEA